MKLYIKNLEKDLCIENVYAFWTLKKASLACSWDVFVTTCNSFMINFFLKLGTRKKKKKKILLTKRGVASILVLG